MKFNHRPWSLFDGSEFETPVIWRGLGLIMGQKAIALLGNLRDEGWFWNIIPETWNVPCGWFQSFNIKAIHVSMRKIWHPVTLGLTRLKPISNVLLQDQEWMWKRADPLKKYRFWCCHPSLYCHDTTERFAPLSKDNPSFTLNPNASSKWTQNTGGTTPLMDWFLCKASDTHVSHSHVSLTPNADLEVNFKRILFDPMESSQYNALAIVFNAPTQPNLSIQCRF